MARTRGRGRRELKSEINIVPLLDVLLVLLLIFMATAPIITQSVEVDLPDATESQAVSSNDEPRSLLKFPVLGNTAWWLRKIVWINCRRSRLSRKRKVACRPIRKRSF